MFSNHLYLEFDSHYAFTYFEFEISINCLFCWDCDMRFIWLHSLFGVCKRLIMRGSKETAILLTRELRVIVLIPYCILYERKCRWESRRLFSIAYIIERDGWQWKCFLSIKKLMLWCVFKKMIFFFKRWVLYITHVMCNIYMTHFFGIAAAAVFFIISFVCIMTVCCVFKKYCTQ